MREALRQFLSSKERLWDRKALTICGGLFVALLALRYLPLQTCEVHGELLKRDRISITYGTIELGSADEMIVEQHLRKHQFPHAQSLIAGGCVINPDSPRRGWIRYCRQCRTAEGEWAKEKSLRRYQTTQAPIHSYQRRSTRQGGLLAIPLY